MTNKRVGEYILQQPIGKGAYSKVYQARKDGCSQRLAIKVIANSGHPSKPVIQTIEKEIQILKKIEHPNIVKLLDTKRTKNNYYLVFEFCAKGDLQNYVHRYYKTGMPQRTTQRLMYEMADAVGLLHSRNIVHRDIKLANILLTKDFIAKLSDFGFAKTQDDPMALMATYCGTPITMAPEIHGRSQYDVKCDIWSLGVITYQLIYNKPPFMPVAGGNILDLMEIIKNNDVAFPEYPPMGDSFKSLIRGALQKEPKMRFSINQFFHHEWIQAGRPSNVELVNCVTTADMLRSVSIPMEEEEPSAPSSPLLDNKETQDFDKAVAKRLYNSLEQQLIRISTELQIVITALSNNPLQNQKFQKLQNFLLFTYCHSIKHTPIVVKYKSDQHTFRIEQILHFAHMVPEVAECEKQPCLTVLSQIIETVAADEKKVSKQESIASYKKIIDLFPLFRRYTMTIDLQMKPGGSNTSPKLKQVMKAFFSASFTDQNTNYLTLQTDYRNKNPEFAQLVGNFKGLVEQRISDLEAQLSNF